VLIYSDGNADEMTKNIPNSTMSSVINHVHCRISGWVRKRKEWWFLKENQHFAVIAQRCKHSTAILAFVQCIPCKKTVQIHQDPKTPSSYMLSNWTRHLKECKKVHKKDPFQQLSLNCFITKCSNKFSVKHTLCLEGTVSTQVEDSGGNPHSINQIAPNYHHSSNTVSIQEISKYEGVLPSSQMLTNDEFEMSEVFSSRNNDKTLSSVTPSTGDEVLSSDKFSTGGVALTRGNLSTGVKY